MQYAWEQVVWLSQCFLSTKNVQWRTLWGYLLSAYALAWQALSYRRNRLFACTLWGNLGFTIILAYACDITPAMSRVVYRTCLLATKLSLMERLKDVGVVLR